MIAGEIIGGLQKIGGWLGIGEGKQDKRQVDQQKKLNEVNAKTSKELADYEQKLKMQMWKDTNYGAQLEQAKLAGVSKAAAIGGSGTGTQGASVSGISGTGAADAAATTNARTASRQADMQLASQMALMTAQKENIEADTANKKAVTGNTTVDTEGKTIANKVATATADMSIEKAANEVRKVRGEAESAFQKGEIDRETQQAQIAKIKQEAIGAGIENELRKSLKDKTDAEKTSIIEGVKQKWQQVSQGWKGLDQNEERIAIEQFGQEIKANYPNVWNVAGKYVNDFVDGVNKLIGQTDYKKHSVKK